jgi:hypothetical protein
MNDSKTIAVSSTIVALLIVMPLGYIGNSLQAQLLPAPPSAPPSAPAKVPPAPKAAVTSGKVPTNMFKIDVILFGIDNKTGNVVTFVNAKNQTEAVAVNATDENIKHENSTGVAEVFFSIPNLKLKVGDKFQACSVLMKDLNLVCSTGLKSPLNKTESVNLMVSSPPTSAVNKSSK